MVPVHYHQVLVSSVAVVDGLTVVGERECEGVSVSVWVGE